MSMRILTRASTRHDCADSSTLLRSKCGLRKWCVYASEWWMSSCSKRARRQATHNKFIITCGSIWRHSSTTKPSARRFCRTCGARLRSSDFECPFGRSGPWRPDYSLNTNMFSMSPDVQVRTARESGIEREETLAVRMR